MRQRAPCNRGLFVQAHQLEIAARDIAGQQHAGSLCVSLGRMHAAQGGVQGGAVLAEKIKLPAGIELGRAGFLDGAGQWCRHKAVFCIELARGIQLAAELRQGGGIGHFGHGLRACQAGLRDFQAGAGFQRLGHQPVQLLVAKVTPPFGGNHRGYFRRGRQTQRRRIAQHGVGRYARHVGTAGDAGGNQARSRHTRGGNQGHAERGAPHRHGVSVLLRHGQREGGIGA